MTPRTTRHKLLPLSVARNPSALGWLGLCAVSGVPEALALRVWPGIAKQVNSEAQTFRFYLAAMPLAPNGTRRETCRRFYQAISPKMVVELLANGAMAGFVSHRDANEVMEALLVQANKLGQWKDFARWHQTELLQQAQGR